MEFERPKQIRMHLDIAPLIDIVFLLLIFFMLTANFIMEPGITITLPSAQHAKEKKVQKIVVFIDEGGSIYLNKQEISLGDLGDVLPGKLDQSKEKIVILKADAKIDLGLAVRVMDIARSAGARDVIIATELITDKINKENFLDE